jgi:hypothetical protein
MSNEVERHVGQGDVFLEDGSVATPLRQSVPQHQSIVAQPQQILAKRVRHGRVAGCRNGIVGRLVHHPRFAANWRALFVVSHRAPQKMRTPRGAT